MMHKINKTSKVGIRLLSCATAFLTAAAMLLSGAVPAFADTGVNKGAVKDETVYVVTGSSGAAHDVIVSDHLSNKNGADKITDCTSLTDIENVKGEESFSRGENGSVVWNAGGSDIYYQGKTDRSVPVMMNIKYYLDGKELSGSELAGKSGEVRIEIEYINNRTVQVGGKIVNVPFAAMTGFLVQDECLKNIEVSSGKVIDDGEKQIVACMAMPGLCNSLGISQEEAGLSDNVEITGTADNFKIEDMMTVVTAGLFGDIDSERISSLNPGEQINALDNAAQALADGSEELYRGLDMLAGKSGMLADGVGKLNGGAQQLRSGSASALNGSRELAAGSLMFSGVLGDKLGLLRNGAQELYAGSGSLYYGAAEMAAGINGDGSAANPGLKAGAANVAAGISEMQTALNGDGSAANPGLVAGAKNLKSGIGDLRTGVSGLSDSMSSKIGGSVSELESAKALLTALINDEAATAEVKEACQNAIDKINSSEAVQKDLSTGISQAVSPEGINRLEQGAVALSGGMEKLAAGINGAAGQPGLAAGASGVSRGIGSIAAGLNGSGTAENPGLVNGAAKLQSGAEMLASGLGAATAEGTKDNPSLTSSAKELADGAAALADGSEALANGAGELAAGMSELNSSSGQLIGGIKRLNSGSLKLKNGMNEFYRDGIKRLVGLYNTKLKGMTENIGAVLKAGKQYSSFSGKPEGMSGSVKFIYKTEICK